MEINGYFRILYGTRVVRCSKTKISRSLFSDYQILVTREGKQVGLLCNDMFDPKYLKLNKLALYYDFLLKINEL